MEGDNPHQTLLIMDTNIYVQDFWQTNARFEALHNFLRSSGSTLIIPEVISREVKKKYRDTVHGDLRDVEKIARRHRGAITTHDSADEMVARFEGAWDERIQSNDWMVEVGLPEELTVGKLLDRSLREHPPFGVESKGFRDAVIWETVLSRARNRFIPVTFISTNHRDFGKEQLHPLLAAESTGLPIRYYNQLIDFLSANQLDLPFLTLRKAEKWLESEVADFKRLFEGELTSELEEDFILEEFEECLPANTIDRPTISSVRYHSRKIKHPYIFREDDINYYVRVEVMIYAKVRLQCRVLDPMGVVRQVGVSKVIAFDEIDYEYKVNRKSGRRTRFYDES